MLAHPTHERLIALGLPGMAKAFEDQRRSPDIAALSFEATTFTHLLSLARGRLT